MYQFMILPHLCNHFYQVFKLSISAIEKKEIGMTAVTLISILWFKFKNITSVFIDCGLKSRYRYRYL